ncbi:hypothetical protein WJX84_001526 [Apatococcus fuscideae]|uniref:Uncharacterized protein n=1 Tax=Apatococcus fuscideae TaxID=2026836 RepID=A0AAW1T4W4_9CHLO
MAGSPCSPIIDWRRQLPAAGLKDKSSRDRQISADANTYMAVAPSCKGRFLTSTGKRTGKPIPVARSAHFSADMPSVALHTSSAFVYSH